MWFNKVFIYYKAEFNSEGDSDFSLKIQNDVPTIYKVIFLLDVYSRIHALCNKLSLSHFNSIIENLIEDSQQFDILEAARITNSTHEFAFHSGLTKAIKKKEVFVFKWSGSTLKSATLQAKVPFRASEANMSYSFTKLFLLLVEKFSPEYSQMILTCIQQLGEHDDFMIRKKIPFKYNKVPKEIFSRTYPHLANIWP